MVQLFLQKKDKVRTETRSYYIHRMQNQSGKISPLSHKGDLLLCWLISGHDENEEEEDALCYLWSLGENVDVPNPPLHFCHARLKREGESLSCSRVKCCDYVAKIKKTLVLHPPLKMYMCPYIYIQRGGQISWEERKERASRLLADSWFSLLSTFFLAPLSEMSSSQVDPRAVLKKCSISNSLLR